MMTIREEIESIIDNLTDRDTLPYVEITDGILKLFEKLIDEKIQENKRKDYELMNVELWEFKEAVYQELKEELGK